jgi:holliday junction DNA helicase RuvA
MIGTLCGIIKQKSPPHLLVDVNGVGYELQAPMTTFYTLPEEEQTVLLYTHLAVREDAHQLYGFAEVKDRDLFRALIKINGVGPKLALSILSSIETQQFVQAIHEQNTTQLVKIPGVGKKTAERLLIECRDALKKWEPGISNNVSNNQIQDAIDALASLGYKNQDAKRAVEKIYQAGKNAEALIREALAQMTTGAR